MRRLVYLVCCAALAGLVVPTPRSASALPTDCSYDINVFTRVGVLLPENPAAVGGAAGPGYHSGAAGCAASNQGVATDTFYVYPGSTVASARLVRMVGAPQSGCLFSPDGGLVAEACGTWPLQEGLVPGHFYAASPLVAMDPTRTSGTLQATAVNYKPSNVYRTLDR